MNMFSYTMLMQAAIRDAARRAAQAEGTYSEAMNETSDSKIRLECRHVGCTWTYIADTQNEANARSRYHAIQVHNDQKAIYGSAF